jgi:hypothetical protein
VLYRNLTIAGALALLAAAALPAQNKDLKVTERFTRVDANNIVYKTTIEDSSTWSGPWTVELPFVATPGPIYEYACHEGNYAIEDILAGARRIEAEDNRAR